MRNVMIFVLIAVWILTGCTPAEEFGAVASESGNRSDAFIKGADVSSLISLENSGAVFYGFDGQPQDVLKTLHEAGMNYIRVRIWNDPYDAQGNGYGGGNCDLENAILLGQRAVQYGMKLMADFHYSDFWADPSKQQAPKAWADMDLAEKEQAIYDYTVASLKSIRDAGVDVGMVQIGNETNNGFCGEFNASGQYRLMAAAARAVRDTDSGILIAVHYTNPEAGNYGVYAADLEAYGVDYDVFATSYYPYWHGTLENLTEQLQLVIESYGKKVLIAETAWAYTAADGDGHPNSVSEQPAPERCPFTVEGQTAALASVISAMERFGENGLGVFYWEPAWIAVPGNSWAERAEKWQAYGSGWASSYAGEYDPDDAGVYFGGSSWDNQALFDFNGYPLESMRVFTGDCTGTEEKP